MRRCYAASRASTIFSADLSIDFVVRVIRHIRVLRPQDPRTRYFMTFAVRRVIVRDGRVVRATVDDRDDWTDPLAHVLAEMDLNVGDGEELAVAALLRLEDG